MTRGHRAGRPSSGRGAAGEGGTPGGGPGGARPARPAGQVLQHAWRPGLAVLNPGLHISIRSLFLNHLVQAFKFAYSALNVNFPHSRIHPPTHSSIHLLLSPSLFVLWARPWRYSHEQEKHSPSPHPSRRHPLNDCIKQNAIGQRSALEKAAFCSNAQG